MRGHDWINSTLPDELIVEILCRLDSKSSRDACSLVCKRWLRLERLSRESLRIGASGSPNALVKLLARRFPNVRNVFIDERLSVPLPVQFRGRLTEYALESEFYSENGETGSEDNGTQSFCLSDAGLTAVGEGFSKIETLSLIWCSNITNVGLRSITEHCKSLKALDLQVFSVVEGLKLGCTPSLKFVDLFQFIGILNIVRYNIYCN